MGLSKDQIAERVAAIKARPRMVRADEKLNRITEKHEAIVKDKRSVIVKAILRANAAHAREVKVRRQKERLEKTRREERIFRIEFEGELARQSIRHEIEDRTFKIRPASEAHEIVLKTGDYHFVKPGVEQR